MGMVTSNKQQLGAGTTDGLVVQPALDSAGNPAKLAFLGGTPVVQPAGNAQAPLTRGQQGGVVATFSSTQSPAIVATITTGERAMTVQSGTGGAMLLGTTDVCFVNKPTAQAGLGVGNIRVSASNTAQVTFSNFSGAGITPTASEVYKIVGIRGVPTISVTLSPAIVAANSIVEQQFTITPATTGSGQNIGLAVGQLVQVAKPTSQAGLDIMGCRVVSNNVIGITFGNVTAAGITPTAAESYLIQCLGGLDAVGNEIMYGMNVGTVGAIGPGTVVTGGSTTLTGVLATDTVTGVFKPTLQAAATNAAIPYSAIPTADTMTLSFFGVGTGYTPTASEVYGIRTWRLNPAAPLLLYSASIAPGSVAANTTAEQTFTVTGLIAGTPVWINKPSWTNGIGIVGCRVSATNTLAITFGNVTAAAITPPTETYIVGNFQVPAPGAGNVVYQAASAFVNQVGNLGNALRSALVSLNLIAGA